MKKFVIRLFLIYTLLSVILVGTLMFLFHMQETSEPVPRKEIYIVNLTDDTIQVHLSGSYQDKEYRLLKDKPDRKEFSFEKSTLPFPFSDQMTGKATRYPVPYRTGTDIGFPDNFALRIEHDGGNTVIDREQFYNLVHGTSRDNSWTLYITDQFFSSQPQ